MLKGILFDLDDTLLDWRGFDGEWRSRETRRLRGVYDYLQGLHPLEDDFEMLVESFLVRTRDGWESARSTLRAPHLGRIMTETLVAVGIPQEKIDLRRCLEAYNWGAVEGVNVFPDVPPMLDMLNKGNIKIGIVTNASQPMWMRDIELEQYGLLRYFPSCRFSAADAGYLKPHPNIFRTALDCLGTKPEETLFVGDNPVADIAGAQSVGMRAVLRVKNPTPPLISGLIIPDRAINTFDELPDVLDEWFPGWQY